VVLSSVVGRESYALTELIKIVENALDWGEIFGTTSPKKKRQEMPKKF
jgi:hypothetical protein